MRKDRPYSTLDCKELIIRDFLATDRTILANERTFLSYARTALALFISGASLIKFIDIFLLQLIGWLLIPLSLFTLGIGIVRYKKIKKSLIEIGIDEPSTVLPESLEEEDLVEDIVSEKNAKLKKDLSEEE